MDWIKNWLDKRRVKNLKQRLSRMKTQAEEDEIEPLMPMMETISGKILRERIKVLEKAVEKLDSMQNQPGFQ